MDHRGRYRVLIGGMMAEFDYNDSGFVNVTSYASGERASRRIAWFVHRFDGFAVNAAQGTPSSIPFGFSMGENAGPLTPAQSQEHALIKLHNDITRILEQRHALENASPHHAPILQNLMQELDAMREVPSVDLPSPATSTVANPAADTTIDEGNKKAYNRYKRLTREQQIGLFDDTSSFNAAFPLSKNHERSYTVFYEADVGETRSRSAHRNRANKQLYARLQTDSELRDQLNEMLGYDVMQHMKTGKGALKNPSPELVWHHPVDNRRVVELIFKKDHQNPDMQKYLHYMPNGAGGYAVHF